MTNFDFFERHSAALFPVQGKTPLPGWSWTENISTDRAQWDRWLSEGHGLALNARKSKIIVCDIDAKGDRDEAWSLWCGLCAEWGIEPAAPAWQTPSGGWHVLFRVPADAPALRQPDAIRGRINVRAGNGYCVAPPSAGYVLLDGAAVHDAPPALIAHCSRAKRTKTAEVPPSLHNFRFEEVAWWCAHKDKADLTWGQSDWAMFGGALKLHFGDDGLELFQFMSDDPDKAAERFEKFSAEYRENDRTLHFYLDRDIDWMFRSVFGCPVLPPKTIPDGTPIILPDGTWGKVGENSRTLIVTERIRPRRVNAASLADKPVPQREWLVPGLIPANNVTLLYGDGGTGKSLLALQLAAAVVAGTHFFGRPVTQGRVEFVTAEDSVDEMHRRLVDVARATAVPIDGLNGLNLTSLADEDAILAAPEDSRGGALVATALYAELESVIAESRPTLLALDTLADVYGGNEIVRSQVRQFISMLRKICLRHGCTIIVLAHPSLAGMDKGTSGSTGWSNSVRSRLYFQRVHENDGQEPDEDARVLRVGKSNYGRVGLEIAMRWQAGVFVPMALTAGGDPLLMAAKAERVFLELLAKYTSQDRAVSLSTGANYAPKMFDAAARPQGIGKRALAEAMGRLLDTGRIVNVPYGPPSRGTKRLVASNPIAAPQG